MSTRAVIARTTGPDQWEGVYHHNDGYPTWLGEEVYTTVNRYIDQAHGDVSQGIKDFEADIIDKHRGGWSVLNTRCYCHDRNEGVDNPFITEETTEPLFHEFVYILDHDHGTMQILAARRKKPTDEYEHYPLALVSFGVTAFPPDFEAIERLTQ